MFSLLNISVTPDDFDALSIQTVIPTCEHGVCTPLNYHDDNIVEEDEQFQVYVMKAPGLDDSVTVNNTRLNVTIIDDDSESWVVMYSHQIIFSHSCFQLLSLVLPLISLVLMNQLVRQKFAFLPKKGSMKNVK